MQRERTYLSSHFPQFVSLPLDRSLYFLILFRFFPFTEPSQIIPGIPLSYISTHSLSEGMLGVTYFLDS